MNFEAFESMLCTHASPVLMGQKPANLISFSRKKFDDFSEILACYSNKLREYGIYFDVICSCKEHELVLVYRPGYLKICLSTQKAKEMLLQDGYPLNASLDERLQILKYRFRNKREFPHEIGLFLGYPIEDVIGFRKNEGSGCKFCGYWKVYGDVESAKATFAEFDKSRLYIRQRLNAGANISQILQERSYFMRSCRP